MTADTTVVSDSDDNTFDDQDDNCIEVPNPDQSDADSDRIGDVRNPK